ncbi:MAG: 16S rRNA (guanine(527)-N(7))-methyltransferase RsmG [Sphingomonas sp.]|nr:16S rRNA (guanine(527)-N(7))-methyltransferase RsmG [Sphingomonas sp.]
MIERLEQAAQRPVSRETFEKLERYVDLLKEENGRQNLISASTFEQVWDRHILDSAQLVRYEPAPGASWVDVGSGAGLPGIVIACLVQGPVTLVEPRRLRAEFLHKVCESLDLRVSVVCAKAGRVDGSFDVITARAVANLRDVLKISAHLSTRKTVWALPKGRSGQAELAEASRTWQFEAREEPSCTDPQSTILVLTGVGARR